MAARSRASNTGILSSSPTRNMNPVRVIEFVFSVYVEALRWADPPSKESFQISKKDSWFQKLILNEDRTESLILKADSDICKQLL